MDKLCTISFPEAKNIVVSGDIHGDFNQVIFKLCVQYQMTGEKIGEPYGAMVVEAHHIIPFTESMNNDTSNIIILSPNYHRIIHKTKAEFNRKQLAFIFPNGLIDKVKLNKHIL